MIFKVKEHNFIYDLATFLLISFLYQIDKKKIDYFLQIGLILATINFVGEEYDTIIVRKLLNQ